MYFQVGVAKVNERDLPTPVKPSGHPPCTRGVGTVGVYFLIGVAKINGRDFHTILL